MYKFRKNLVEIVVLVEDSLFRKSKVVETAAPSALNYLVTLLGSHRGC